MGGGGRGGFTKRPASLQPHSYYDNCPFHQFIRSPRESIIKLNGWDIFLNFWLIKREKYDNDKVIIKFLIKHNLYLTNNMMIPIRIIIKQK